MSINLPQDEARDLDQNAVSAVDLFALEKTDAADLLSDSTFWRNLIDEPYRADLFAVLRWIDSTRQEGPVLGRASLPRFDPVRLGQEPSLTFAASSIAHVGAGSAKRPPQMNIYSFGLFGPNGPLPLHLTEYVRDRLRRFNDPTMIRFADVFHHRLILLFYRAWADSNASTSMDRVNTDRFTAYVASLIGYGQPAMRQRDMIPDHAKLFQNAHFSRQTRNPEGLAKILREFLQIPVKVEEFIPHWTVFTAEQQTRLDSHGEQNNCLGKGAFIGERVLDYQRKIRLRLGPMSHTRYRELLPDGNAIKQITAWIRNYIGLELLVDLQMVLRREEVPQARLGSMDQLGFSAWLGKREKPGDADDLLIHWDLTENLQKNRQQQQTAEN